jgi:hypothetical protein
LFKFLEAAFAVRPGKALPRQAVYFLEVAGGVRLAAPPAVVEPVASGDNFKTLRIAAVNTRQVVGRARRF